MVVVGVGVRGRGLFVAGIGALWLRLVEADRVASVIEQRLEAEVRPLIGKDYRSEGGYDCCGCATYDLILDHAVRIVREETTEGDTKK